MATDVTARFACTADPPHHFTVASRARASGGIVVTLARLDAPYPPRDVFVTSREMKMTNDDVVKACFVCVDKGIKEKAIALSKAEIEAGLPPE
jgi:hypothetical protein